MTQEEETATEEDQASRIPADRSSARTRSLFPFRPYGRSFI